MGNPHSEDLCLLRPQLCLWPSVWAVFIYLHTEMCVQNHASNRANLWRTQTLIQGLTVMFCQLINVWSCTQSAEIPVWDHGWLNNPIVKEFVRDVGDLSVSSCSSEFRTWTWCWSHHIPDDCTSITFLALLCPPPLPFCVLVTRSWHNFPDDILVRNDTFLSLTVNKAVCWWKGKKVF